MRKDSGRVCPVERSGGLDNKFRKLLQNPQKLLKPYIKEDMTVLDLGCGPGFFTIEIARMLKGRGKVIAADLQEGMLDIVRKKIEGTELQEKITLHKCQENFIGLEDKVDLIWAFYMVHEVTDHDKLFTELKNSLKSGGQLFICEPKFHVSKKSFESMEKCLAKYDLEAIAWPKLFFSRTILVRKG